MKLRHQLMFAAAMVLPFALWPQTAAPRQSVVEYTAGGQLKVPENYREWVFLSSGLGMTYGPAAQGAETHLMFDNVFVNPDGYRGFLQTGKWPDKTMFVLEIRGSKTNASINKGGHTQGDVHDIEVEVKDASAKTGMWTFYGFPGGKAFPASATCYQCHGKNTAVENTFVQFYPTLMPVAQKMGTLKSDFGKPGFSK